MSDASAPRSVLDPALIPSILPRARQLAALLQVAPERGSSQAPQEAGAEDAAAADRGEATAQDSRAEPGTADARGDAAPALALGAIADNDDMDMFVEDTSNVRSGPGRLDSELTSRLAREATALRATLDEARAAVRATPGNDMTVEEQLALRERLQAYEAKQRYVPVQRTGH